MRASSGIERSASHAVGGAPVLTYARHGHGASGPARMPRPVSYMHHEADVVLPAVLAEFGGFEIAMMVGAFLAAAERRLVIVVDGFIVTAALLVAARMQPAVCDYCVFAHRSGEPGHQLQLDALGAVPLFDLGMRLREGTGAALALPLLQAACAMLAEMASFESAGVAEKMP